MQLNPKQPKKITPGLFFITAAFHEGFGWKFMQASERWGVVRPVSHSSSYPAVLTGKGWHLLMFSFPRTWKRPHSQRQDVRLCIRYSLFIQKDSFKLIESYASIFKCYQLKRELLLLAHWHFYLQYVAQWARINTHLSWKKVCKAPNIYFFIIQIVQIASGFHNQQIFLFVH